ncbi:MAG: hypothetical protein NTW07_00900, partial [candidate division Zixibacteria bacterium]|nr:hypothetical protein [candidate division Zixibacteria bacterium]
MATIQTTTDLIKRLQLILTRQRLVLFLAGLMAVIAALIAAAIGLSAVAYVAVLSVWFKITVLLAVALGVAYL